MDVSMRSIRSLRVGVTLAMVLVALANPIAQTSPSPRTRYLSSLTNIEVENYLQRNDLVFVPIGTVQAHGVLPVDAEYVAAQALALRMAEASDGLVFPYLQFTYPGAGVIGRGTIHVSPSEALPYLKAIARSLLRQGFKRQIYVTSHNAAAPQTVSPLVLEFFYETRHPVLYLHGDILLSQVGADFTKALFGAYSIVGRLNDIPVHLTPEIAELPSNDGLRTLRALGTSVGGRDGAVGFFQPEDREGPTSRAVTAEQRAAWAKEGAAMIEAAVKAADVRKVADALRDHQRFTREYLIPRFGDLLPK
jgi:creatinine amidohydrolase